MEGHGGVEVTLKALAAEPLLYASPAGRGLNAASRSPLYTVSPSKAAPDGGTIVSKVHTVSTQPCRPLSSEVTRLSAGL